MSFRRRRVFFVRVRAVAALSLALLLAGGCAARPLYGDGEDAAGIAQPMADVFSATEIGDIYDRDGVILSHRLRTLLHANGRPTAARWRLEVVLSEESRDFSIRLDETASRLRLRLHAEWRFVSLSDEARAWSGRVSSSVAYDVVTSAFATEIAATAARDAALERLAEELVQDLALVLAARS
ncbi:MAG: LPS assembly lipoprotein LptE [Alphaproteobacteria bacterium]|nr:LPS assembly lipoprotein LptE [Alphaproteobacteria bacterium]